MPSPAPHPLDPLTEAEVTATRSVVLAEVERRAIGEKLLFSTMEVDDVAKQQVYDAEREEFLRDVPPGSVDRVVFVTLLARSSPTRVYAVRVSLTKTEVLSFEEQPAGTQANIHIEEFLEAEKLVHASPAFREAMSRRGLTDTSQLMVEPWSAGYWGDATQRGRRIVRAQVWARSPATAAEAPTELHRLDNGYAHPVSGLVAVVNLNDGSVTVEDAAETPIPVPQPNHNFTRSYVGSPRNDVKPIEITQPEGTSFKVTGHLVEWQGWSFRVGFNWREALTLHHVDFKENSDLPENAGARRRPILNKISCSEMVVPYLSPDDIHRYKNAFDMGEYGVGFCCNALSLGCDCLGQIHYFDAVLNTTGGEPMVMTNAICLHEEDFGVLWKHTDWRLELNGHKEAASLARSTRLVISCMVTVGNYEYGFFYYFYPDGGMHVEIKATGLVNTSAVRPGEEPEAGQALGDGLEAQHHQHCFAYRIDPAVDGLLNSVVETNTFKETDKARNPYGNAVKVVPTTFETETEAQRDVNPQTMRTWKIVNESKRNRVGEPTAYRLSPGTATAFTILADDSWVLRRASFMKHHLWVTQYSKDELFAAGRYPNQGDGAGVGLENWASADRPVRNADIVVWHVVNMHHVVRLEDFPVMPVEYHGFSLKPVGFFDANPALRVPAVRGSSSCSKRC